MQHRKFKVTGFDFLGSYVIRVSFDDGSAQTIYLEPVLKGGVFGPLHDVDMYRRVRLDVEVHTLVRPNGADFDPETLWNRPKYGGAMMGLAIEREIRARDPSVLGKPSFSDRSA